LSRHDLSVSSRDLDTGIQAGFIMGLNDIALDNLSSAYTTVILALGSRETTGGPAIRSVVRAEEGILLFQAKPRLVVGVGVHDLHAIVTEVVFVGSAIGIPALSKNNNVGRAAEGIGVDCAGTEVDIGVVTRGLVGGRTIKVPHGKIFRLVFLLGQCARLGTSATIGVNPDILSHDHTLLIKLEILLESLRP